MTILDLITEAHETSIRHGWWQDQACEALTGGAPLRELAEHAIPEKLCLIHSEVSEALEEYREGRLHTWSTRNGKPEGLLVELADVLIRIGDLVGALGASAEFETALTEKLSYNQSRPFRHGGKKA